MIFVPLMEIFLTYMFFFFLIKLTLNLIFAVTSVASGLQAWNILKDHRIHVDLVLTEVVMPGPSGIDLLSKMMSHRTCKDIPVISEYISDTLSSVGK